MRSVAAPCEAAGEAWWTWLPGLTINRRSSGPGSRSAQVAQLVEHATENRSVGGSIPPLGTISPDRRVNATGPRSVLCMEREPTAAPESFDRNRRSPAASADHCRPQRGRDHYKGRTSGWRLAAARQQHKQRPCRHRRREITNGAERAEAIDQNAANDRADRDRYLESRYKQAARRFSFV
jgi:hypothetical protein